MFTRKAKPIRITRVRISGVLLYCVSLRAAFCSQTEYVSLSLSSPSSSTHHYFTGSLWFIVPPTWQRLLSINVKVWGYSCPCARHEGTAPLILKTRHKIGVNGQPQAPGRFTPEERSPHTPSSTEG